MGSETPSFGADACPYFSPMSPYASPLRQSSPIKVSESTFYEGTIGSSSTQAVYVHVRPDGTPPEGPGFWVTLAWTQLTKELLTHESVLQHLMDQLHSPGHAKQRMQSIRNLANTGLPPTDNAATSNNGIFNDLPPMPSPPPAPEFQIDSPLFPIPEDLSLWKSHRGSIGASPFSSIPVSYDGASSRDGPDILTCDAWLAKDTPNTPAYPDSAAYYSTSPSEVAQPHLFSPHLRCLTAGQDVIDPAVLQERPSNLNTEEFVWSPSDCCLYGIGNPRAPAALKEPDAVKLVFPPATMLIAKEKDGMMASPAYTLTHPHSNEW